MKKASGTLANTILEKIAKLFTLEKEIETLSFFLSLSTICYVINIL